MKKVCLLKRGDLTLSIAKYLEIQIWLKQLPRMQRTGTRAYSDNESGLKIWFKRDEDAVAFRLKFGL